MQISKLKSPKLFIVIVLVHISASFAFSQECNSITQDFNSAKDSFKVVAGSLASKYYYSKANENECQFGIMPVSRGGKWTYINTNTCTEICSFLFDSVGVFKAIETSNDDTLFFAKAIYKGQEVKVDAAGNFVFDALELNVYTKSGKKGLSYSNEDGSIKLTLSPALYDNLSVEDLMSSTEGYGVFIAKSGGKYGLVNVVGKEILKCEYDKIYVPDLELSDMFFAFLEQGKKTGICNKNGKILVPVEYDKIKYYATTGITDDGVFRFAVKKDGKEGMFSVGKGLVFPCIYDEVFFVDNDGEGGELLIARNKKVIGLYPPPGSKRQADEGYESVLPLAEGLRLACKGGKWGAVDASSKVVVDFKYEDIKYVDYKYLWVMQKGKWGQIDRQGNFLIQPAYDDVKGQQAPFITVMEKDNWGLLDEKGVPKSAFVYSRLSYVFDRKLWLATYNKKEGILDDQGNQYLAPEYDKIQEIFDKYIIVKKGEGFGAIDHKGNKIIDFRYSKLVPLKDGYFSAIVKKKYGVVDSLNNVVLQFEFDDLYPDRTNNYIVKKESLWGLYGKDGKMIINILYDKVIDFKDGYAKVNKEGKTLWVDVHGKEYTENPVKKKRRGKGSSSESENKEKPKTEED